jgi:hypothetical protein
VLGEREERALSGDVNGAISFLKLPQMGGKAIPGQEILSEVMKDIYLSYDDEHQPHLKGETFHKIGKERFDKLASFFRNYEKATLEAARLRAKSRMFPRGPSSSSNGQPRRVPTVRQVADMLFDGGSPNT